MKFIQENLFFVIVAAVAVILCGLLFGVAMHFDTVFNEQLQLRSKIAVRIRNRQAKEPVNDKIKLAKEQYKSRAKKDVKDAQFQNVVWTTRNFKIPVLELSGTGKKTVSAIPYDRKLWRDNMLFSKYVSFYSSRINDMLSPAGKLKMLKITRPPNKKELDASAALLLDAIMLEKKRRAGRTVSGDGSATVDNTEAQRKAMIGAIREWKLKKSKDGLVYANYNSLNPIWQSGEVVNNLTATQVWNAQIDLWVKEEVVRAITKTIDDVMTENKVAEAERNVIRSPIKRILGVTVVPVVSEKESKASADSADSFKRGGAGDGRDIGRPARGGRRVTPVKQSQPEDIPTKLTRETSNTIFEVYDYSLVLLMPVRYLPKLQRNLIKQNYHVITNIRVEQPDPEAEEISELYYYGTEPLRKVVIDAQLRLMTAWTRGEGSITGNKITWDRKPLMPKEAVKALSKNALREIDTKHIYRH